MALQTIAVRRRLSTSERRRYSSCHMPDRRTSLAPQLLEQRTRLAGRDEIAFAFVKLHCLVQRGNRFARAACHGQNLRQTHERGAARVEILATLGHRNQLTAKPLCLLELPSPRGQQRANPSPA